MRLYVTQEGESLYDVADRCHVEFGVLQAVNKHIKDPTHIPGDTQITIPSIMGMEEVQMSHQPKAIHHKNQGNVCAYVEDEIVHYNKPNITHWPSQDYTHPHPKNGTHAAEIFGQNAMPKPPPNFSSKQNTGPYTQKPVNVKPHIQSGLNRTSRYYQKD